MDDQSLLRYSRHLLLDEIGVEGQERIGRARLLVVGAGGLGSPAAMYLAAAGVARLTLVDDDTVELGNLQRQVLHTTDRVGQQKAASAAQALRALNPEVAVDARCARVSERNLRELLALADVVLDCSDNRATRYALNRACHALRLPLVSGAANGFAGQLAVFDFRHDDSPCYACLFPEATGEDEPCATTGIFAPLTGIIGALQAGEALKLVAGAGTYGDSGAGAALRRGRLLTIDALELEFHALQFARDPQCPVCSSTGRRS
jgi:molybdopterin-synthase adenylyltransferase